MQKIFKRLLLPGFLRHLDAFLLSSYPLVWRTRVHFVLFYGMLGAVLLFLLGYNASLSATNLLVDPIKPIEMLKDDQYHWAFTALLPFLLFWGYTQYQSGYPFYKAKDTLLTLLIYTVCCWFLLGITAPAYRMGTIYKTAQWMDDKDETGKTDLERFDSSGIYPFGFVLLKSDTAVESQQNSFYQRRESIFKEIWRTEDTLLLHRYDKDTTFWFPFLLRVGISRSDRSYLSYLPDLSDLSDGADLSVLSYQSYQSYLPDLSDLSDGAYQPYLLYRSDLSDGAQPYLLYRSEAPYWPYLLEYSNLRTERYKSLTLSLPSKYGFISGVDYFLDTTLVFRSQLPNSVEDAVRSVRHAQQYLEKGVFLNHFWGIGFLIVFCSLLLFFVPFLSIRYFILILISGLIGVIFFIEFKSIGQYWHNYLAFLYLPFIGAMLLLLSALQKRLSPFLIFSGCSFLFIGLSFTLFPFYSYFVGSNLNIGLPYNHAFFGVQILGILGAFLMTYVQALPRKV